MTKISRGRVVAAILAALMLVVLLVGIAGCKGEAGATGPKGDTGAQGPKGDPGEDATVACTACHNDTGTVNAKLYQWEESGHGEGVAWAYAGGRNNCTACHSGTGFEDWLAAGGATSAITAIENNTPIDCRTCHKIHTTFTGADFALVTAAPVNLIVEDNRVYDAGASNLCANCHQARTAAGATAVTSTHYGAHHGPQANMLVGVSGYGGSGEVSPHQTGDGCVTCHMAADPAFGVGGHYFTPSLEGCQECHEGLDTFDRHDVQTEIGELLAELGEMLEDIGALHQEDGEWHPVVGEWGEVVTGAVFNFMYVLEDGSMGVHNPFYAMELLENSIEDLS